MLAVIIRMHLRIIQYMWSLSGLCIYSCLLLCFPMLPLHNHIMFLAPLFSPGLIYHVFCATLSPLSFILLSLSQKSITAGPILTDVSIPTMHLRWQGKRSHGKRAKLLGCTDVVFSKDIFATFNANAEVLHSRNMNTVKGFHKSFI